MITTNKQMRIELKQILSELSLNDVEIKVFLAHLELGPAVASKIASSAGLNRVTTYEALKRLSKKGLVKIRAKKGNTIRYFEAEDLETLQDKLGAKKTELETLIEEAGSLKTEFRSLYKMSAEKPVVLFYEGKEGIKTVLKDTLKQHPTEVLSFVSADFLELGFGKDFLDSYWGDRARLKIPARGIMPRTEKAVSTFTPERNQKELRRLKFISPELYKFNNLFDIYGDNVSILSLAKGNEHGIIIRSKSIAAGLAGLFEFFWASV